MKLNDMIARNGYKCTNHCR